MHINITREWLLFIIASIGFTVAPMLANVSQSFTASVVIASIAALCAAFIMLIGRG